MMLLSRFWYLALGLGVGALLFLLGLAQSEMNRAQRLAVSEGLNSDRQVVHWYLKEDARNRASLLVKYAVNRELRALLQRSSVREQGLKAKERDEARSALAKVQESIDKEMAFDALFAIDRRGRVVAHLGYPELDGQSDFELGAHPLVADALHGYIRDDTWLWNRLYRVVARPVEYESGAAPAGAIVGARLIDDRFARLLSARTGAAVAFYADGSRSASGAPEGFSKSSLDQIVTDLPGLAEDEDYQKSGHSEVRDVGGMLGVQYSRLSGEAYHLGAGFAVARELSLLRTPFDFFQRADELDKKNAKPLVALVALAIVAFIGLLLSFFE
ncbi:MAG: hypothetical protein MK135_16495, partial [Polyangiaceae bacterium]|nr:hypothetical protein [Polyangiaceae bacterium]